MPKIWNSGDGRTAPVRQAACMPSLYASKEAWAKGERFLSCSRAIGMMPNVRISLSVPKVAEPRISDNSPCMTRRLNSSCQPRSCACTKPMARQASRGDAAWMCVTSEASRPMLTGSVRPGNCNWPSSWGKLRSICTAKTPPASKTATTANTLNRPSHFMRQSPCFVFFQSIKCGPKPSARHALR